MRIKEGWLVQPETLGPAAGPLALLALAMIAAAGCGGDDSSQTTGGGDPVACLEPSAYSHLLTIADPALCAVAMYEADADFTTSMPAWGRHQGPLTVSPSATTGALDLVRWQVPGASTGMLTPSTTSIADAYPPDAFLGVQVIDLPFFNWTAASWTGAFPDTAGELLLLDGGSVQTRHAVNGYFAAVGIAAASGHGRLLHTSLSAIEDAATNQSGLYAADSCGTAAQNPRLLPDTDAACSAPATISQWGDSTGPIAADLDGNVFAIMTSLGAGTQEARGFEASTVARGAGSTAGDVLFTLPGFGSSLAAMGPDASATGTLVFQPFDGTSFEALDAVALHYRAADKNITAEGDVIPLLELGTPNTTLALFTDAGGRLWVAAPGQTGGTTLVVIAPRP